MVLLIAAGTWLRTANLSTASFWVDEVNVVFAAQSLNAGTGGVLPSGMAYTRAPVYTAVTAFFYRLLGVNETTSRIPAALFGILCIPLAYGITRRVFSRQAGLMTAFLVAFSHFEIGWSRVARMYTLLQCLALLIVWTFLMAYERKPSTGDMTSNPEKQKVSLPWLLLCGLLMLVSVFGVHMLTLFLGAGILAYVAFRAGLQLLTQSDLPRWINPYSITLGLALLSIAGLWIVSAGLRSMIENYLQYTPPWAVEGSAQNRLVLFEFLIDMVRFPLAAFFFIGALQCLFRDQKQGWALLIAFGVPLLLLSGLFTHRVPTYIFYVYPFFLAIAAYGFVNIVGFEHDLLQSRLEGRVPGRSAITALFLMIFILSPWFRVSVKIPHFPDGQTNMAVTPDEWKEACRIVNNEKEEGEMILASLPQVAYYYEVKADFGLNWANLAQSRKMEFTRNGELVDVYAGIPFVQTLDELKMLTEQNAGWMLISRFYQDHDAYIPEEIRNYILNHFNPPRQTRNGTVLIYYWNPGSSEKTVRSGI